MRYNIKVTAEHMSNCYEIIYKHFVDRSYVPFRLDGPVFSFFTCYYNAFQFDSQFLRGPRRNTVLRLCQFTRLR